MKIRDIRHLAKSKPSLHKRSLGDIHTIVIHHTHTTADKQQFFHYCVYDSGLIEYQTDLAYDVGSSESIDICLVGNFDTQHPTPLQLQTTAELISYLLIPRLATPNLSRAECVISHFASDAATTCPGKTWTHWKGYILGNKTFSQPDFLAEFVGQKIILPASGTITFKVVFKNSGNKTWCNHGEQPVKLNVCWEGNTSSAKLWKKYHIPQGSSIFRHASWVDDFCPSIMNEQEIKPGELASFMVTLSGNQLRPGIYLEDFGLAQGTLWIDNLVNGNPSGKAHCWFEIEVV